MALTLLEQETIITFNREEREAEIYTFDPKMIRIFTKFSEEHPDLCQHVEPATELHAHVFTLEKGLLTIRPKRMLSEEQREAARERVRKLSTPRGEIQPKPAQEEEQ